MILPNRRNTMTDHEEGDLRVWWIPQVPMSPFYVNVGTTDQGKWLCSVLASYDIFQYENNIKPDYSNVGGIQIFEDGDWWDSEDTA